MIPEITAEQVMELAPARPAAAQRIARYVTLRAQGVRIADAMRELGLSSDSTVAKYEHWARALQEKLALPEFAYDRSDYREM